ncbi:HU family DNA-binding protein [Lactobacillus taiwanensis]|uniref:HU family DNA-binding protein n=1 Tax=Lactobacillus taiwanensis TaxID=508451 RepID=UPI0024332645|nr:HU family DNA-binding protein [Lactobacillus taiwanensis]
MATIGKKELVKLIAAKMNTTQIEADKFVNTFIDVIESQVAEGNRVRLIGFGSFDKRDRGARRGLDIRSGKPITIPATTVPAFTSGSEFRKKVKKIAEESK